MNKNNSLFADRFSEAMKKKEIKQQQIADAVGITRQAISAYCTGNSEPSIDTLLQISKHLDVSVSWLLGETEDTMAITKEELSCITLKDLISTVLNISPDAIDMIQHDEHLRRNLDLLAKAKKE